MIKQDTNRNATACDAGVTLPKRSLDRASAAGLSPIPRPNRCINCGDVFDEDTEKAVRGEPHGNWRPCPNPRPGSREFEDSGVGRHMYWPQVERDVDEIMLDGCICPCGCGERDHRWLSDSVAEAIEQLEAWAQWWLDASCFCDWPLACNDLALEALQEGHRRRVDSDDDDDEDEDEENEDQALAHLEAAALLRDGWRP